MRARLALFAALAIAAAAPACFSTPDYKEGGRLASLPGASDDGGDDGAADGSAPVDAFTAPQDHYVAPPVDAAGTGRDP